MAFWQLKVCYLDLQENEFHDEELYFEDMEQALSWALRVDLDREIQKIALEKKWLSIYSKEYVLNKKGE